MKAPEKGTYGLTEVTANGSAGILPASLPLSKAEERGHLALQGGRRQLNPILHPQMLSYYCCPPCTFLEHRTLGVEIFLMWDGKRPVLRLHSGSSSLRGQAHANDSWLLVFARPCSGRF